MGRDIRGFEIKLASPCTVEWSSMSGTERVRFCGLCQKSVYELSGLTRDEVLALLEAKPDACVSFFQREDGTVLTADCPVGERLTRTARRLAWTAKAITVSVGSAVAGGLLSLCGVTLFNQTATIAEDCMREPAPARSSRRSGAGMIVPRGPYVPNPVPMKVLFPPEEKHLRDPRPTGPLPRDIRDLQTRE